MKAQAPEFPTGNSLPVAAQQSRVADPSGGPNVAAAQGDGDTGRVEVDTCDLRCSPLY